MSNVIDQLAAKENMDRSAAPRLYSEIVQRDAAGEATPQDSVDLQACMRVLGLTFRDVQNDRDALREVRQMERTPGPDASAALNAMQEASDEAKAEEERHRLAVQAIDLKRNAASNANASAASANQNRSNRLAALRTNHPRVFGATLTPPPDEPDAPAQTGGWSPTPGPNFAAQLKKFGGMVNQSVDIPQRAGIR